MIADARVIVTTIVYNRPSMAEPGVEASRFEILPFASGEQQAAELPEPARLTITTSPRHGVDRTVEVAERVRALGHAVTIHLAARMVRNQEHLDAIVTRASAAGVDDLFVVGGDATEPHGPYRSAGDLLDVLAQHPSRPPRIGIAGYPEGHPLIDDGTLAAELKRKSAIATYMVTQLCFDVDALVSWVEATRARGVSLPLQVGLPGPVDRRRLLDISVRVGVGPSLRFIRKQRRIGWLFGSPAHVATRLYDAVAPLVGDERLGIVGFHFFTFNELVKTWSWERERRKAVAASAASG